MQTHEPAVTHLPDGCICSRVYSRIGLLGNPSDGYGGNVLSISLKNFSARVTLNPSSPTIEFLANPIEDRTSFSTIDDFTGHVDGFGYDGGVRLLMAMTRRFFEYCKMKNIALDTTRTFSLSYTTTIPRQRGLSGSSAIALGALNCLIEYFAVSEEAVPVAERPELVLSAERELGITAGLQDRVIQVYGGAVLMYFNIDPPVYTSLPTDLFSGDRYPELRLYIIWSNSKTPGKTSNSVHSPFKGRWEKGVGEDSEQLRGQMAKIAALPDRFHSTMVSKVLSIESKGSFLTPSTTILNREEYIDTLKTFMNENFNLRRQMFGEAALDQESLRMVEVARSVGAAAKFAGSGGAVVALANGEQEAEKLVKACSEAGFDVSLVEVGPMHHSAP